MTKEDIRKISFDYPINLKGLDKIALLHYINILENKIIQMDKERIKEI